MSENVSTEKLKPQDKKVGINIRVDLEWRKNLDAYLGKREKTGYLVDLANADMAKAGVKSPAINYTQLQEEASNCRRSMEKQVKILNGNAVKDKIENVVCQQFDLNPENFDAIIDFLATYKPSEEEGFDNFNAEDYIMYLEAMQKHQKFMQMIADYRASNKTEDTAVSSKKPKAKGRPDRRYIPHELLCGCGIYETKDEHNARCLKYRLELTKNNAKGLKARNIKPKTETPPNEEDEESDSENTTDED